MTMGPQSFHLLLVQPDAESAEQLLEALGPSLPATLAFDLEEALPLILSGPRVDLCLVEAPKALDDGRLSRIHAADPDIEIVAIVPAEEPRLGPLAIRAGCGDYVLWPSEPEELRALVTRALDRARLRREHRRLLAENIEFLTAQALYRRCLELLSMVDLEPLHEMILKVFAEMADAQSAALWVRNERGQLVLRAHRGLWAKASLPAQIEPSNGPLAARLEGGLPFAAEPGEGHSFYTPLCVGGQPLGLLLLADKLSGGFTAEDFARARAVGDFGAIALKNARRFAELERVGLRDRDSPAYNVSYFIDYAGKELYKAHRYGRQFSLVAIRVDNLEELRRRLGSADLALAIRQLVGKLAALIRDADILSKVAEGEFYSVLPETDRFGAMMFERRVLTLAHALAKETPEGAEPLRVTVGGATYPGDGHDFDELLHHCRLRMEEGRQTLCRKLQLDELGFWESVEALVGPRASRAALLRASGGPTQASQPMALGAGHFAAVQREIGRELARDPRARGLVYVGSAEVRPDLPILTDLPATDLATRVYLLGRRGATALGHLHVTPVFLDVAPVAGGHAASQHDFVLYLSEKSAYGFVQRRAEGGGSFHTSDRLLVDHLISRLQQAYDLQPY